MPRKAAKVRKAAWQVALIEGRVIKINGGETFKSFPTVAQTNIALADYLASGLKAEILGTYPEVPRNCNTEDFKMFCSETGRPWEQYANIPLMAEFANWCARRKQRCL